MRREDGFTVAELAVVVMLLAIVTLITFSFLDSTTATTARATRNAQAEMDAQIALRTMTEDIRSANPISGTYPSGGTCPAGGSFPSGYASCLRFTIVATTSSAYCIDPEVGRIPAPYSRITYGLAGGVVRQDRTDYSATCGVVRSYTGRPVIRNVVNPASQPLFTYYKDKGALISPLNSFDVTSADQIKTTLVLRYQQGAPTLELTSVAAPRNTRGG